MRQLSQIAFRLRQARWHDYAIRFFFGGLITAIAGIIAKEFGAVVGGLFLAFPAIFPASATLIEKHEKQKKEKEKEGLQGSERGRGGSEYRGGGFRKLLAASSRVEIEPNHVNFALGEQKRCRISP